MSPPTFARRALLLAALITACGTPPAAAPAVAPEAETAAEPPAPMKPGLLTTPCGNARCAWDEYCCDRLCSRCAPKWWLCIQGCAPGGDPWTEAVPSGPSAAVE